MVNTQPKMEVNRVIHKEKSRLKACKAFQSQELSKDDGKK